MLQSLADKINMLMARPGPENAQKDDVPWWMRYAARGLGTVGSSRMYHFLFILPIYI